MPVFQSSSCVCVHIRSAMTDVRIRRLSCSSEAPVEFFSLPASCAVTDMCTRAHVQPQRDPALLGRSHYEKRADSLAEHYPLSGPRRQPNPPPPLSSSSRGSCPAVPLISGEIRQLETERSHCFMRSLHLNRWGSDLGFHGWVFT